MNQNKNQQPDANRSQKDEKDQKNQTPNLDEDGTASFARILKTNFVCF